MPKILLDVSHRRQSKHSDCLAACAAMCLSYVNVDIRYDRLCELLRITPFGASGRNLLNLEALGVHVLYREGTVADLKQHIDAGRPCIVLVRTTELSYWNYTTDHAVVIVGYDNRSVFLHDPVFDEAPIETPLTEFEIAWMAMEYRYSVITR